MTDCEHCKALANTRNLHRRANERAKKAEEAARIERKRAVDAQELVDRHLAQVDELGVENERLRAKMAMCSDALEHASVAVDIMARELGVEVMADTQPDVLARGMLGLVDGLRVEVEKLQKGKLNWFDQWKAKCEEIEPLRCKVNRTEAGVIRDVSEVLERNHRAAFDIEASRLLRAAIGDAFVSTDPREMVAELVRQMDWMNERDDKLIADKARHDADLMAMQAQRDVAYRQFGMWMATEWKP